VIEREIQNARRLYARWSEELSREKELLERLEKYREAIPQTLEQMLRAGVLGACASCGAGPAGSCCFQGVEDWYDDILLLINLLLGLELPDQRELPGGCFFVGEKGCRLMARHAFCVNYLCPALAGTIGLEEKSNLLALSGQELLCGWELEMELRHWLKKAGHEA
jgi:hypothetical protein